MSDDGPWATHSYGDGCDEDHGSWERLDAARQAEAQLADALANVLDTERALADDLYAALDNLPPAVLELLKDFDWCDVVDLLKARYRKAREQ